MAIACDWAKGARLPDEARDRLTRSLYGLGGQKQRGPNGAVIDYGDKSSYTIDDRFVVEDFVALVQLDGDVSSTFNCDDAASAIASLACILGVPTGTTAILRRHRRETDPTLEPRCYLPVGFRRSERTGLLHHTVATTFDRRFPDRRVWDGCYKLLPVSSRDQCQGVMDPPVGETLNVHRPSRKDFLSRLLRSRKVQLDITASLPWFSIVRE